MAWLSKTDWLAADKPVLATVLNNIGLDLRTWGGNVDAGGNSLANLAGIIGANGALGVTGKVGIGTPYPWANLSVARPNGTGTDPSLTHQTAATAAFGVIGSTELALFNSGASPYSVSLQARHNTIDGAPYPLALNPLGGNVGINCLAPTAMLTIGQSPVGALMTNAKVFISGVGGTSDSTPRNILCLGVDYNQDYGAFLGTMYFTDNTAGTVLGSRHAGIDHPAIYLRQGNVGIGRVSPVASFDVGVNPALNVTSVLARFGVTANDDYSLNVWQRWDGSGIYYGLRVKVAGAEKELFDFLDGNIHMAPTGTQLVGMGVATPRCKADVAGAIAFSNSANLGGVDLASGAWTATGGGVIGWNKVGGDGEFSLCSISGGGGDGGFSFFDRNDMLLRLLKRGDLIYKVPASAVNDARLQNGFASVWYDEAGSRLVFRVRSSTGGLKTGYVSVA